jgi:hypothetical protein
MNTEPKEAAISISIEHPEPNIQELYFEQFLELKTVLHATLEEEWAWKLRQLEDGGKVISRIYKELPGASVFNREDWPDLISFFKPRIIALDAFWENAKWSFERLK